MVKNIFTKGFLEFESLVPKLAFILDNIYRGKGNKHKILQSLSVNFMPIKTDARHLRFSKEFYLISSFFLLQELVILVN